MNRHLLAAILICSLIIVSCGTKNPKTLRSPQSQVYSNAGNRPPVPGRTNSSGQQYIDRYKEIAIREMNEYGIPASIKLAQALLESGNGNSELARTANNHFGIKCGGSWSGKSTRRADDSPNDCFRVYTNPEESFRDHTQFLLRKRYEKLFTLAKNDYKGWARGLKSAGYATNPKYADLLIDLIERYNLQQFDNPESYVQREVREERVEEIIEKKEEKVEAEIQPEVVKRQVAMSIYEVKSQDTLYSISKKFNISEEELLELNGLTDHNVSLGQLLVVSK